MTSTNRDWARAFARQAKVDFQVWKLLQTNRPPGVPSCQKLHFLQMACEKLCKAHLCKTGSDPLSLQSSHAYIWKNLALVVRDELESFALKEGFVAAFLRFTKNISREIELLSPAVDDGGRRPDNCEYPWLDLGNNICVPVDWTYFTEDLLTKPNGRSLLKLIGDAIARLS